MSRLLLIGPMIGWPVALSYAQRLADSGADKGLGRANGGLHIITLGKFSGNTG